MFELHQSLVELPLPELLAELFACAPVLLLLVGGRRLKAGRGPDGRQQQIEEALMSGVTTMLGGGTGPATGTYATTCTPGPWHILSMLAAAEAFPMNIGFLGKGNASLPEPLRVAHLVAAATVKGESHGRAGTP